MTIEYLAACQKIAENISGTDSGNNLKQRFQKFLLSGDAFALESVLHLLGEVFCPILPDGRYQGFLQFAAEAENREKVLSGFADKFTSRDSERTGQFNNSGAVNNSTMLAYGEIQQRQDMLKQTLQSSVGLYGVAEIARQAFHDTTLPAVSQVNILQWLADFCALFSKSATTEKFKERLTKDSTVLQKIF